MKENIKSDFYYKWINKKIYIYAMLFMVIYILATSIGNMEWKSSQTLYSVFTLMVNQQYLMIMIVLLGMTCYYQGKMFENRLLMYQIVSHGKTETVLSKYIVQSFFNIVFFSSSLFLAMIFLCNVYKVQLQMDIKILVLYLFLVMLIIRYTVRLVSMVYFTKNGIVGGLITWFVVVAELMPLLIGREYSVSELVDFAKYFLPGQIFSLTMGENLVGTVFIILITTSIEMSVEIFWVIKKNKNEMF